MEPTNPYQISDEDVQDPTHGNPDSGYPLSPQGRFGRLSYIAWAGLLAIVANLASYAMLGSLHPDAMNTAGPVALAVVVAVMLVYIVLSVIVAMRRCHDFNKPGWLLLLSLVPLINVLFGIYLLVRKGSPNANDYGPVRPTRTWEKALASLVLTVVGLLLIVVIAGAVGYLMSQMGVDNAWLRPNT